MNDRVKEITYSDGKHYAWWIMCPGCGSSHELDKRWQFNGNKERPTFGPVSKGAAHSLLVTWDYGEGAEKVRHCCHSFIADGKIRFLGDCTHKLAGQTVELPTVDNWEK